MKIRIKNNSIRLRLTKTEVDMFAKMGKFTATTQFGTKTLTYALKAKPNISEVEADFVGDGIVVYFPEAASKTWAKSNRVGYDNNVDWNDETKLSVLVEKDFTCLDNTIEDQSDNYPNPKLQG